MTPMKKITQYVKRACLLTVVAVAGGLCLSPEGATVSAQTVDDAPARYSVGYYRDNAFLRNDSNFTVVDTQLEWPEAIDFADLRPLQTALDSILFESATPDGQQAYTQFKQRMGQPVTGQLAFLPDDRRFCYVTTTVRVKAYQPRQWLCMELHQRVEPQPLSPLAARDIYRILTFDLLTDRVMQTEDLLRVARLGNLDQESFAILFEQLSDRQFYGLKKADVDGVWIDGTTQTVGMHIACATDDEAFAYERVLPIRSMTTLLTRDAKRLMGRKQSDRQPVFTPMRLTWEGDSIYNKVDKMPSFTGGREALNHYLTTISLFDRSTDSTARGEAIVAFVVDKQGQPCDVHVVGPVSPMADRHAVTIVKGMPRWQPGSHQGRAVPVRVYQRFQY